MSHELITPDRAKEIRRAALRHAGGMLMVSLSEWEPRKYNPDSARDAAEEEPLREEVERIADELKARAIVGTSQPCVECNRSFRIKADGTVGHHDGISFSGYASGERCPGVGKPPRRH